ncbi:GntR family transcriptional regulator [Alicyclobacillus cycloheptanicus]|nr:GntR family transcriptional regulator [Alicyclobacillus cycloheptanicus]
MYLPGTRLFEEKISEEFEMSLTPIREAMKQFEADGIVTRKQHQALFVRSFSWEEAKNVYDLRRVLEPFAIELSGQNVDHNTLSILDGLIDQQAVALKTGRNDELQYLNYRFHVTLAKMSRNQLLENMIERLWMMVPLLRAAAWSVSETRPVRVLEEHRMIVDCLRNNPAQAVEAARVHVNHSWDNVRSALLQALHT